MNKENDNTDDKLSSIPIPTLEQLSSEFDFLQSSEFEGVKGVLCIDSGKPGPVLGITVNTHGNEPSGIAALWYLRNKLRIEDKLLQGSIFFVINNLKATERYFAARAKNNEIAKNESRFCDHNMNRLPENVMSLKGDVRYEVLRAQELRSIWKRFEVALDIHSTAKESDPMIIACGGLQNDLIRGFPIDIIVLNIENIQIGKPALQFYGNQEEIKAFIIEAGSHEDDTSFTCSITCVLALLRSLQLIAGKNDVNLRERQIYEVSGSLLFPNTSFELERVFKMFEPIKEGQILARGNGTRIVADFDGHVLMGPKGKKVNSTNEEVLFISRPVKKITAEY